MSTTSSKIYSCVDNIKLIILHYFQEQNIILQYKFGMKLTTYFMLERCN
jgi:hypothetical protein